MPIVHYTLTEYETDPGRQHIVLGMQDCEVELPSVNDFYMWAAEKYPAPRWTTELHVGQSLIHDQP